MNCRVRFVGRCCDCIMHCCTFLAHLLCLVVLLAFYSEDVMRTVEREVRKSEALIRQKYPGAEYIELEPMSVDVDRLAIDGK